MAGTYLLKNKTGHNIDTIFVNLPRQIITKINRLEFSKQTELMSSGGPFGFRIFKLNKPLVAGDQIELNFDLEAETQGFTDNNPKNEISENGTSISLSSWGTNEYFPTIGFDDNYLILNSDKREELHLPKGEVIPDPEKAKSSFQKNKIPFITYNAVISTSIRQTVISNGNLVKRWAKNGRNHFHFNSKTRMVKEIRIVSGVYEVKREKHDGIDIAIYYLKKHPWNIQRIMKGAKSALAYYSNNFSPYPYSTFKIVEVPNYMTTGGAVSQPSIVVWREDIGFTSKVNDSYGVDQLFGITAHEITHNWWPGIVLPEWSMGMEILSETIAEYVRVMCIEKEYGKAMVRRHLKREMKSYLSRRRRDVEGELPLIRSHPRQHFLSYQKSAVVMYALQDYIGEDNVNKALRTLIGKFAYNEGNLPTSIDLMDEFRALTPDSLQYVIADLFEYITLYENKAVSATFRKIEDGQFKVKLQVSSEKFRADKVGNQTEIPLNDYIYIGVLGVNDEELYLQKHKLTAKQSEIEIIVDKKPMQAGIDPHLVLIDRNRENNLVEVKMQDIQE